MENLIDGEDNIQTESNLYSLKLFFPNDDCDFYIINSQDKSNKEKNCAIRVSGQRLLFYDVQTVLKSLLSKSYSSIDLFLQTMDGEYKIGRNDTYNLKDDEIDKAIEDHHYRLKRADTLTEEEENRKIKKGKAISLGSGSVASVYEVYTIEEKRTAILKIYEVIEKFGIQYRQYEEMLKRLWKDYLLPFNMKMPAYRIEKEQIYSIIADKNNIGAKIYEYWIDTINRVKHLDEDQILRNELGEKMSLTLGFIIMERYTITLGDFIEKFDDYISDDKTRKVEYMKKIDDIINAIKILLIAKDKLLLYHGHLHTENIMFKFDDKKVFEKGVIIDYRRAELYPNYDEYFSKRLDDLQVLYDHTKAVVREYPHIDKIYFTYFELGLLGMISNLQKKKKEKKRRKLKSLLLSD